MLKENGSKLISVEFEKNLRKVKEQIGNNNVEIIAVTKYATDDQVKKAYEVGIRDFGESYVQDAIKRISYLEEFTKNTENPIRWHLVGRLQKNKIKHAVGKFFLIHSVDSHEKAELINKVAETNKLKQQLLLQVNISKDLSKAGFSEEGLIKIFDKLIQLPNIEVSGLMTIAPHTNDTKITGDCFKGLSNLRKMLNKKHNVNMEKLSMGMSNDYLIAIESGATMIRIGRVLFDESLTANILNKNKGG